MNGYRVLVVEDDGATRKALRRLLAHRGLLVSVAQSVTEGMAQLDPPPHCILLDLMLPDGDGEEILRRVREDNLPSKVVVCTGTNDPVRMALVKGLTPDFLFHKPIDLEAIFAACEDETLADIEWRDEAMEGTHD